MITKRCFICGSKENGGQCTNQKCPRNAISADPETTNQQETKNK